MIKLPISAFEKKLTFLIAGGHTRPRLDKLMIIISDPYQWLTPTLFFSLILIYLDWESGLAAFVTGAISAGIADGINTRLLKRHTDRIRPGKQYPDIRSLGTMNKGLKSFPSNHASNTMAFALSFGLFFPWVLWIMVALSLLVGYSRIYCGAHFPLDVLSGWIHGAVWAFIISSIIIFFNLL